MGTPRALKGKCRLQNQTRMETRLYMKGDEIRTQSSILHETATTNSIRESLYKLVGTEVERSEGQITPENGVRV